MSILLLLLLLLGAFASAAMAQTTWPNCEWIQNTSCEDKFPPNGTCVSEDGRINKAWLGNCTTEAKLEPCTPGTLIDNVCIWAEFDKGPKRYQIYSFFDLYINNQDQGTHCDCNDTIPAQTHVNRSIYGPLQWTCGQKIELKNILVAWSVNKNCSCSDPACCDKQLCVCDQGHPKCWGGGNITVDAPFVANFTFDNVCFCTYTTFTDNTTGGHGSYIYDWNFDDDTPHSTAPNPTHHYNKSGTYNVTLRVKDSGTNTSSVSKDVTVWPTPVADFTINNSPQIYCLPFTFNDTTTGGTPLYQNWTWDFGDGSSYSYQQNTSYTYSTNGTYNVTLTVKDAHNCTNSTIKTVVALNYTADLAITKTANVSNATVGDTIGYNITVNNTGNVDLTNVLVTDVKLGLSHTIPTMVPNASQSFTPSYTVTQADMCEPINNTATANGTDPCGDAVGPVNASESVSTGFTALLTIIKSANVTSATVGDTIGYNITVNNTGNVDLTNVLVTDVKLGLSHTIPTMVPNASQTFNPSYTVTQADMCEPINNTATANGTDPCGDAVGPETASMSVPTTLSPSLDITKTANVSTATVGTVIGYNITVNNTGNVNLTNVLVTDSLTGLSQNIPTLIPNASQSYYPSYTVTQADICEPINNTATANGTDPCGGAVGPETASVSVPTTLSPSLDITKTANVSTATVGTVIGYNITVNNTGNVNLTNVLVTDSLTGLSQNIPTLVPNASQSYYPSYTVTQADICEPINNTATANGTDPCGGAVGPETASVSVPTTLSPSLDITKTANVSSATVGTVIGYNITVNNTGNVNLTNVLVTDSLTGLSQNIPTLIPNASQSYYPSYTVTQADICEPINNTATANGTDPCGDAVGPETASVSVPTTLSPSLDITKTANVSTATVGTVIGYNITVNNTGNVNLTNVLVTDSLTGLSQNIPTLIPNASQSYYPSYTVTQADICEPINNTATANGTDPCGDAVGPETASVSVPTTLSPSLDITKTANVSTATVGTVIGYNITVNNTGNVNLTNVLVTDSLTGLSQTIPNLIPGASQTFYPSYTVTQADICEPINNTATANGTDPCGDAVGPETASVSVPTTLSPSLDITKTANVSTATVGTVIGYNITVNNTGNVNLTNVLVTDSLTGLSQTIPNLIPGASQTFYPSYTVTQADICEPINNTATANGTDPCGGAVGPVSASVSVTPTYDAELSIVKTASLTGSCPGSDPLAVNISDTVTYCFNVSNTGDVNLTGVTVNDNVYGSVTLATTSLAPGETTGGTITHVVVEANAPSVTNTATATGTDPLGGTVTDTDPCTINVAIAPDIEVIKTASLTGACPGSDPLAVSIGDTVTYCFNVSNTGDVNLTGVTVNDNVYGSVTLATTSLAPGETTGGTITHVVVEANAPSVTNTATATGTDPLGGTVTDTDPCTINVAIAPDIEVIKTASLTGTCPGSDPLAVSIGDTVTYCFNVTNTGNVNLTGVTVNDNIYGSVTLATTSLAPGETTGGTITHVVVEADAPSVTNTATANGTDTCGVTVTDTDPCTINVAIAPDIEVIKTASLTGTCPGSDPLAVSIGDTVTYCFNVTNTGDVNLTGVTVNDNVYGSVTLLNTTLAPGETTGGTVTHVVVESDAPSVTNTATATGTDPLGGTVNDTDDCTINVNIHPDVELEKTSSPAIVAPGETVTYTINYTNTGTVPLHDVVITEHYPKGVTFISASPAPDAGTNNVWTIGTLLPGESGTIVIKVKVPEPIDLSFTETGSVIGEGLVMVTKDLSTEQKPYSLRNRVTLSCDELAPVSAYATTKVSGVPGTSLGITESGSGVYSSDEILDLETKNKSIILKKTTHAEYKPTSFNFSDGFSVNFTNKWKQDICSKNMEIDAAIHKKISDATYIDDETISRVDKDKSTMNFDSSFNGSLHIGARTKDTEISETYIGEFDVLQTIQIAKGPIPTPAPTPTPTPIWLPCPFNDSQEMNTTEDAEPTHDAKIKIEMSANRTSATVGDVIRYSYVVTNIGNINLTGVTVTDSNLGLVDLNRTELEPTEVANGTLLYTVNQSDVCANITNTADVTATDGFGDPVTNTSNQVIVTTDS